MLLDAKLKVAHRDLAGGPARQHRQHELSGRTRGPDLCDGHAQEAGELEPCFSWLMSANALVVGNDAAGDPVREDALDFTAAMKPYFDVYGFAGVKAKYTATVTPGASATAMLDGVRLDITYEVPGFRAQNTPGSCVGAFPYTNGSSGPCAFIKADGSNPETRLYVQGTTYAPLGALDITLNNVSEQVFRFGVIARAVKVAITGSSSFTGAVIAVPDDSPAYAATVPLAAHLQVYVCETGGSCPAPRLLCPVRTSRLPAVAGSGVSAHRCGWSTSPTRPLRGSGRWTSSAGTTRGSPRPSRGSAAMPRRAWRRCRVPASVFRQGRYLGIPHRAIRRTARSRRRPGHLLETLG